jgi:uncharacterized membrane protein YhaH (DUF805 family)
MSFKTLLTYLWKLPLCGLAFFVSVMFGGMAATGVGLPTPSLPTGTDSATLAVYLLLARLVLALTLAVVSRRLRGGFVARWLSLSCLTWVVYAVNTYLEASIFTTFLAASPYLVVMNFVPSFVCGAAVALLFPPESAGQSFVSRAETYFARHTTGQWACQSSC